MKRFLPLCWDFCACLGIAWTAGFLLFVYIHQRAEADARAKRETLDWLALLPQRHNPDPLLTPEQAKKWYPTYDDYLIDRAESNAMDFGSDLLFDDMMQMREEETDAEINRIELEKHLGLLPASEPPFSSRACMKVVADATSGWSLDTTLPPGDVYPTPRPGETAYIGENTFEMRMEPGEQERIDEQMKDFIGKMIDITRKAKEGK